VARAPLAARFGADLLRQLDRALGREREPLQPRLPVAPYVAEQPFAEPILREEDVLAVAERLAQRLSVMLERRGEGMRRIELELFRTDGQVYRIAAATSRPIRDVRAVRALFSERLAALADPLDPGFGFDLARLNVLTAEPCPPQQAALDETQDDGDLDRLVDRLSARLGARRVTRLIAQDSHVPELAAVSVPAQAAGAAHGWTAFRHFRNTVVLSPRRGRSRSKPSPACRTARRCASAGGARCTRSPVPRDPNASRAPGGARMRDRHAIISASRMAPVTASGYSAPGFIAKRRRRIGSCTGCSRDESDKRQPHGEERGEAARLEP